MNSLSRRLSAAAVAGILAVSLSSCQTYVADGYYHPGTYAGGDYAPGYYAGYAAPVYVGAYYAPYYPSCYRPYYSSCYVPRTYCAPAYYRGGYGYRGGSAGGHGRGCR